MTEQHPIQPAPHRRADDFQLQQDNNSDLFPGEERRARRASRTPGKSFLKRFRQPIIGLTMAGAAAPLINAGTSHEQPKQNVAGTTEAEQARHASATQAGDAEDQIASKIAEEATTSTSSVVHDAIDEYKIDEGLAKDIYEIAQKEGIEPKLAYGLVHTESSFKTHAQSGVGARGLTQVMPKTANWVTPGTKADDLWDQKTNLKLGFKYLNQLIDKYHGNVRHALLAYNRGPGTVDKILKRGGNPNNGYADKVIGGSKFGS
ncbi:MAG TPA: lytic transglycosylase domain-containing protein [Longimicrobiales bacterium]|nr:lytic transglycosylase domain-containing protein [Longimicrobiales bacterium]